MFIFWTIWEERNPRSFDNEEQSNHALKSSFISNLFSWVKSFINVDVIYLYSILLIGWVITKGGELFLWTLSWLCLLASIIIILCPLVHCIFFSAFYAILSFTC